MTESFQNNRSDVVHMLKQLDSNLQSYVALYDADGLADEIKRASLSTTQDYKEGYSQIADLSRKENEYVLQLDIANKLWFINGLLNELAIIDTVDDAQHDDWHFVDLVSSVSNLEKLRQKVLEFETHVSKNLAKNHEGDVGSITIIKDIQKRQESFDLKIKKLVSMTGKAHLETKEDSIILHNEFNGQEFGQFLDSVATASATMRLASSDVLFNWTNTVYQWTENILKQLENDAGLLRFSKDPEISHLVFLPKGTYSLSDLIDTTNIAEGSQSIQKFVFSITNLVEFVDELVHLSNIGSGIRKPSSKLKQQLVKPILASLKLQVFNPRNKSLIFSLVSEKLGLKTDQSANSGDLLSSLLESLSGDGWYSSSSGAIETWLEDPLGYWSENELETTIENLRAFCIELKKITQSSVPNSMFTKLSVNETHGGFENTEMKPESPQVPPATKPDNDEWNSQWDEDNDVDDAWNKEIDLDVDDVSEKKDDELDANADDNGWDDWKDDDDDLGWTEKPKPKTQLNSPSELSKLPKAQKAFTYKSSQVPAKLLALFEDFFNRSEELTNHSQLSFPQSKRIRQSFIEKFKPFALSFFAMVSRDWKQYYPSPTLLYNDFGKLLELAHTQHKDFENTLVPELLILQDLNTRFIQSMILSIRTSLDEAVNKAERILFVDDNDMFSADDMSITASKLGHKAREVFDEVFQAFYQNTETFEYNETLNMSIISTTINHFYSNIITKLISRKSIGEAESDVLAQLIDYILMATVPAPISSSNSTVAALPAELKKSPSFHKLANIKTILTSRLNDILNQFYEGVFFDMETEEMISLLHALFTDSPTRRSVIDEIKEIRSS
ncbi:unnamed protein product [Kuraishia capsulata CBS 1993]|uniref:Retrograde transport protein Dsl1 C-terminal domain-containing protein n=1 Tax=Kuraishia capsulata CBS 1993 TaxID=1382522 RepID=W6ML63_9ASCO|nr:uncharacterized protein KUCA_T00002812001 [Kuraishia capsulata CBS 1993]CDK26838.1 unnamed protein product [Kuraishia capsulata CBS 1993]